MTEKGKLEAIRAEIKRIMAEEMSLFEEQCQGGFEPSPSSPVVYTRMQMLLKFIDALPEEPVSEDLEEAIKEHAEKERLRKAESESPFFMPTDFANGFKAGSQWKERQMMKDAKQSDELELTGFEDAVFRLLIDEGFYYDGFHLSAEELSKQIVSLIRKKFLEAAFGFFENDLCCYIEAQHFTIDLERLQKGFRKAIKEGGDV